MQETLGVSGQLSVVENQLLIELFLEEVECRAGQHDSPGNPMLAPQRHVLTREKCCVQRDTQKEVGCEFNAQLLCYKDKKVLEVRINER